MDIAQSTKQKIKALELNLNKTITYGNRRMKEFAVFTVSNIFINASRFIRRVTFSIIIQSVLKT